MAEEIAPDLIDQILEASTPSAGYVTLHRAYIDRLMIHGERKGTEMSETGEIDTILLLEFGTTSAPLEVVLSEVKPGSPEEIRKHLESLEIRSGLFVYVAGYNQIFTAEDYLALWNRVDHVFYLKDLANCSAPVKTGSPRDIIKYLKEREVGSWRNYYVIRTDIAQIFTPAQYMGLSSAEPA